MTPVDTRDLGFRERVGLALGHEPSPGSQPPIDDALVQSRINRWKSKPAFRGDLGFFQQRLISEDIPDEALPLIVHRNILTAFPGDASKYVARVAAIVRQHSDIWLELQKNSEWATGVQETLLLPFRQFASRDLDDEVRRSHRTGYGYFESSPSAAFINVLSGRLRRFVLPTSVLEQRIFALEQGLTESTAEDQARAFLRYLCTPDQAVEFFARYPLLCRFIVLAIEQWKSATFEFCGRLERDCPAINAVLSDLIQVGSIRSMEAAGDFHQQGRFVGIVKFTDGRRLAYKPRDMELENAVAEFITWVGAETRLLLRQPRTIVRKGYGWQEYLGHEECADPLQFANYYRRLGGILAIGRLISAADLHYQNLVAHGDLPIVVDGEAFVRPRTAMELARVDSVLDLLPVLDLSVLPKKLQRTGSEIFDSAAFAAESGKRLPDTQAVVKGGGQEPHQIVEVNGLSSGVTSRPYCGKKFARPRDFERQFIEGFEIAYKFLMDRKDTAEMADRLGSLRGEQRYVMRATASYVNRVLDLMHPDVCQDAFEAELLLEELWPTQGERARLSCEIVASERAQLWRLDVPVFHSHTGERHLKCGDSIVVRDYFVKSGSDMLTLMKDRLSSEDLDLQLWAIRAAINAHDECAMPIAQGRKIFESPEARDNQCLARIAEIVARSAITQDGGFPRWVTHTVGPKQSLLFKFTGQDLYDGAAGIALFLVAFRVLTKNDEYISLERNVIAGLEEHVRTAIIGPSALFGAFSGMAGCFYALSAIGSLDPSAVRGDTELARSTVFKQLADGALRVFDDKSAALSQPRYDVISGAAGGIVALLDTNCGEPQTKDELLSAAGRYLVKLLDETQHPGAFQILSGFSHGLGGIAYALTQLSIRTGRSEFARAAAQAIEREDLVFDAARQNWKDLRDLGDTAHSEANADRFSIAWCHGASGIGLYRLALVRSGISLNNAGSIHAAAVTTLANCGGGNAGLCHGTFGRLAFLARYRKSYPHYLNSAEVAEAVEVGRDRLRLKLAEDFRRSEYYGKIGFMNGLCGVGYELLQQVADYHLPDPLLLSMRSRW
jgi:type 2 lantibiotic biosynthesis protein LanM